MDIFKETVEKMSFDEWMVEVERIFEENEPDLLKLVALAEESGLFVFNKHRGDEPHDAYDSKDTPEEYASFLIGEYKLFGPKGE